MGHPIGSVVASRGAPDRSIDINQSTKTLTWDVENYYGENLCEETITFKNGLAASYSTNCP